MVQIILDQMLKEYHNLSRSMLQVAICLEDKIFCSFSDVSTMLERWHASCKEVTASLSYKNVGITVLEKRFVLEVSRTKGMLYRRNTPTCTQGFYIR